MFYKNTSCSVKTFYGVTFEPGQINEVADYINDRFMVPVDKPAEKSKIEVQQKPSPAKSKKDAVPVDALEPTKEESSTDDINKETKKTK